MRASGHAEHTGEASSRHLNFSDSAAHEKIRFLFCFVLLLFFFCETPNQFGAVCSSCVNVNDATVPSLPRAFLVKVTTWSLDYNTSSETTVVAGFFKFSH